MERLHMNYLRDLIHRLRANESERRIARDLRISRTTVRHYHEIAQQHGFLSPDSAIPDDATLVAVLGPAPRPPTTPSTVEPYAEVVERLLDQGVEMTAIWQRLRQDYGYTGGYSSVRRFVRRVRPSEPRVVIRVHTLPVVPASVGTSPRLGFP